MQRNVKICFYLFIFCYISILISYQFKSVFIQKTLGISWLSISNNNEPSIKGVKIYNKFVSADYRYCGGMGNQLYHIAVYYGIGRILNRTPLYFANKDCESRAIKSMKSIFPNIPKHIKLITPKMRESKFVDPLKKCCNVSEYTNVKEKYLIFKNHVPHFYQFFHRFRDEILYLMKFDSNLIHNVSHLSKSFFQNDSSHKFCIHIRRGDFMSPWYRYQESRASFIAPASTYIYNYLTKQGHSNISLILLGQDEKFKHSLRFNSTLFTKIYHPTFSNHDQEFAFGTLYCDTFLLSATASTFAWWIAYLMPVGRNIFYNSQVYKKGDSSKYIFDSVFPSTWKKVDLTL